MNDVITEMLADLGPDTGPGSVGEILAALEDLVPREAPAPNTELAALLAGAAPLTPARSLTAARRRRRRRAMLTGGAAAALLITGVGTAAATNHLPDAAQRAIASFSEHFLPVHFPRPKDHPRPVLPRRPGQLPTSPAASPGMPAGVATSAVPPAKRATPGVPTSASHSQRGAGHVSDQGAQHRRQSPGRPVSTNPASPQTHAHRRAHHTHPGKVVPSPGSPASDRAAATEAANRDGRGSGTGH